MTTEKAGKVWAILVIVFALIYTVSACMTLSSILKNVGIPWFDEIVQVVVFMMPILLFYYAYENPQIIFVAVADQKRVLMTKRFWDDIKNYPEDKLDLVEDEMHTLLRSIQYNDDKVSGNVGQ